MVRRCQGPKRDSSKRAQIAGPRRWRWSCSMNRRSREKRGRNRARAVTTEYARRFAEAAIVRRSSMFNLLQRCFGIRENNRKFVKSGTESRFGDSPNSSTHSRDPVWGANYRQKIAAPIHHLGYRLLRVPSNINRIGNECHAHIEGDPFSYALERRPEEFTQSEKYNAAAGRKRIEIAQQVE